MPNVPSGPYWHKYHRADESKLHCFREDGAHYVQVGLPLLEAKLGETSFFVWRSLRDLRGREGLVWITDGGIAKRCQLKLDNAKRVLRRLRASGLLEPLGWKVLPVGKEHAEIDVFLRRVHGTEERGVIAFVPVATAAWLKSAPAWGGAREGAGGAREGGGRPQGTGRRCICGLHADVRLYRGRERCIFCRAKESKRQKWFTLRQGTLAENSKIGGASRVPLETIASISMKRGESVSSNEETRAPVPPAVARRAGEASSQVECEVEVVAGPTSQQPDLAAASTSTPPTKTPRAVPPYPGFDRTQDVVCYPRPPPLPAALGPQHRVRRLLDAYRGAVAEAEGKPCFTGARGLKPRMAAKLQRAAAALIDTGVPPQGWAAYSVDLWDKPGRPPLAWVWNVKRIEFQGDVWDWLDHHRMMSGTTVVGTTTGGLRPARKAIVDRYHQGVAELARCRDDAQWSETLARYEADLERLIIASRHEAALLKQKLKEDAESGRYIWSVQRALVTASKFSSKARVKP